MVRKLLNRIWSLGVLAVHDLGARFRRRFRAGQWSLKDWQRQQHTTPWVVLRGCLADLDTAFHRMGRRLDALPEDWTYCAGPVFERDPKGNLQLNRCSLAYMSDTERFQRSYPKATLFDLELYRFGWVAGVEYGQGRSCTGDAVNKPSVAPSERDKRTTVD